MNICRGDHLRPPLIPYWETVAMDGLVVGVISLPADLPCKPYKAKRGRAREVFIRRGTTSVPQVALDAEEDERP